MENNDDKAKEDFLLRSVDSNDTTDLPSSSKDVTKPITNKNNDLKNSKSSNKIIKNLIILILIVVSIFYIFKSCDRDKTSYYDIALESFNSGKTEKGFEYINEAIDMDNSYPDALLLRGEQYMKIEEFQDAEYDFTELINLNENNWKAYYLRGKSYIGQATSKYSSSYEKAIDDFTMSIALESGSANSDSYYLRGDCKEISMGEFAGCADFNLSCDLGHEDGCARYNDLCYPKTGFMPYEKYFGKGVHSGRNTIEFDNTNGKLDILLLLVNAKTGIKIRSQFLRQGEELEMENIPDGIYTLRTLKGNNWTFDKIMEDGITKGGFTMNEETKEYESLFNEIWSPRIISNSGFQFSVIGGDLEGKDITQEEFMK